LNPPRGTLFMQINMSDQSKLANARLKAIAPFAR